MNDSLSAELMVCRGCHKPLDARPSQPEGHPDNMSPCRQPFIDDDICSVCCEGSRSQDALSTNSLDCGLLSEEASWIVTRKCHGFAPSDIEESVEYVPNQADVFSERAMDTTRAWVISSSLNTSGGAVESEQPRPENGDTVCVGGCRSSRSTSTDSGLVDCRPISPVEQDNQLFTLEEEISAKVDRLDSGADTSPTGSGTPTDTYRECSRLSTEGDKSPPSAEQVVLDPQTCPTHPRFRLSIYCATCDRVVCKECEHSQHVRGHVCLKLEEFLLRQKQVLQRMIDKIQGRVEQCKHAADGLGAYESALKTKRRLLQTTLEERGRYYHSLIDRWMGKTAIELETTCDHELQTLEESKSRVDDILRKMQSVSKRAETLVAGQEIQTGSGPETLMACGKSVTTEMMNLSDREIPLCPDPLCFIMNRGSGEIDLQTLGTFSAMRLDRKSAGANQTRPGARAQDGGVRATPTPRVVSKPKHLRSFESRQVHKHCDYMATGLSVLDNGHLLVSDVGTDAVKSFDTMGRRKTHFITLPEDHPTKAVQLQDGTIAVSCKNDIKLFIPRGDYWKKLAQDLYSPQSVTLDPNGDLVVCDVTRNGSSAVKFYARRDYELLRTVELAPACGTQHDSGDISGAPNSKLTAPHHPWYVHVTRQMNIVITDAIDHTAKAFTQRGKMLWTAGGKGAGPSQFFTPAGLCQDVFGHIIVADCGNDRVHMLSPEGEFLTVVLSEEDDIERPMDVSVDKAGHLWVLQGDGQVKAFEYLF